MPLYYFRVKTGQFSGANERGIEFADDNAAREEFARTSGDLVGGIARKLKTDAEWQIELLDTNRRPIFRMRLIAESL